LTWLLAIKARTPPPWIAGSVHASDNDNPLTLDTVVETIRKAFKQNATGTTMNHWVGIWKRKDRCNGGIHCSDELVT
jgi:hypothetical protein